ncbi:hypothetical protein VJ918_09265 [Adlercreutzia sp. R21]|uniref:hypothetical protein n=1 Tax=Adlercreutzia wanghongyangiae TaxID=3111451 RepID=UPI002DB87063|nr:hypothetical protein [Adlercreutzia sp. R21]MEC4184994.1 hypothetical protein [Adlercreutzia sp. R21]
MADMSSGKTMLLRGKEVKLGVWCAVLTAALALVLAAPFSAFADEVYAAPSAVDGGGVVALDNEDDFDYDFQLGYWMRSSNGKWWFEYEDGTYAVGPAVIETDGTYAVYYFDKSGWMVTGWYKENGDWFYFKPSGALATGWQKVSGKWYYLSPENGVMLKGWQQIGGKWYRLNGSGAMLTGWQKVGGSWYYLNGAGDMATGWKKVGGKWYYLNESGAMFTGWREINGTWYHLNNSGAMSSSRWVGNYYVNGSGAMVTNAWVGKYYVGSDGKWIPNYSANNSSNNATVFWVAGGDVYHSTSDCPSLARSKNIKSGTVSDADGAGKKRVCPNCFH